LRISIGTRAGLGLVLGLLALVTAGSAANAGSAASAVPSQDGVYRHTGRPDTRAVRDRLHARNNPHGDDLGFLNGVGVIWPGGVRSANGGADGGTGFLIDSCHVLTNMHVIHRDADVAHPAIGATVEFAVGQTEGETNRGAERGLKFLIPGTVVEHGDAIIVNHTAHDPENDWALIRLATPVDGSISSLSIGAAEPSALPAHRSLSSAGFPADHRQRRGDGFNFKDLWGADGDVVRILRVSTIGALLETTLPATRGSSGSPVYGSFGEDRHLVVGMIQSVRGSGIAPSEDQPNIAILFTPALVANLRTARLHTPCP